MQKVHLIHIHPGAGQLHLTRTEQAIARQARQQPAHGQRRRGFQAQHRVVDTQGVTGAFQRLEAIAQPRQQHARRFGELQAAAPTLEQAAGEVFFQSAHMPTDRTLGDRQLFGGAGEGALPRRRLEGAQGIQRRQALAHDCNP